MNIPKIKFKKMSLEENIETIKWAYFENNGSLDVHKYVLKYFEELQIIDKSWPKDKIYKLIEDVVTKDYKNYEKKIEEEVTRYNNLWQSYNDKYFNALSKYFNTNFPDNITEIVANVGLIPVFPRYLDSFSFSLSTKLPNDKIIRTAAHETLHFMWFKKWKEMHPETPRRHYDSPYIEWKYSEMVTDPILNNEPFKSMFNFEEKGYESFYKELDNDGNSVMDNLREIYSYDASTEDKIENGFNYINSLNKQKNK